MASNKSQQAGSANPFISDQDKIFCTRGRHYCSRAEFSKTQLARYNPSLPAYKMHSVGISCRQHSGEPVTEIRCQGPCGHVLPLTKFSGASKKAGGRKWCLDCTDWQVSQEYGVAIFAAPGMRTDGVKEKLHALPGFSDSHAFPLGRHDDDDDDDNTLPAANQSNQSNSTPSLARLKNANAGDSLPAQASTEKVAGWLADGGTSNIGRSTPSTPADTQSVSTRTSTQTQTVISEDASSRDRFNVWGPHGERGVRAFARTNDTATESIIATTTTTEKTRSNGKWADVHQRRTELLVPGYLKSRQVEAYDSDGSEDYC